MNDLRKTKAQLIEELQELRSRLAHAEQHVADAPVPDPADPATLERIASHGAWVVDTDFIVRVANDEMCRLLDKSANEVVGRKCYDLMHGPRCHSEQCAMRRAFADPGSVAAEETRTPLGRVPLACRVVAHLVHDKGHEAMGIIEQMDEARPIRATTPKRHATPRPIASAIDPTPLPTPHRLAEVALEVAESLRRRLPDDDDAQGEIAKLESACAPFQGNARTDEKTPTTDVRKPTLREVAPHRSVLILAPPTSCIRGEWTDVVRRAGYALRTDGDTNASAQAEEPTVAILDLALGEPIADDLHQRLRLEHPNVPILVVSSSSTGPLEARRWRRAHTWYVPRTIDGDELVRLIEDVTPKPVLRSRYER